MLCHITINNFTIIEELDLSFASGMTVVTGETGAGKSIMIDALELALGGRAESNMVRRGSDRCDVIATFDLTRIPGAQLWLQEQELVSQEECIIRRCIMNDGRSRSFINGHPVPLQQLREFGTFLINIHGQHEHQTLLKREAQRKLLDAFADNGNLITAIADTYKQWRHAQDELTRLQTLSNQRNARSEFLNYQLQELDALALGDNELQEIEKEHKQLANVDHILDNCQLALHYMTEDEDRNALSLLQRTQTALEHIDHADDRITQTIALVSNALIEVQEASNELKHYLDSIELNPDRLLMIEQRLRQIHDLARKHHTSAEHIPQLHRLLQQELQQLEHSDERIQELQLLIRTLHDQYIETANKLSKNRQAAAKKLTKLVTDSMQNLGMLGGRFAIQFERGDQFTSHGLERVEFIVSANPGQPLQPLSKVASGGELSRISLAIQVIAAQCDETPTLIFDEVDVGVGGSIAAIIGQLLRTLSQATQVLCVTHLPQVAAQGHHHLRVNKHTQDGMTHTEVQTLTFAEKIDEIARMLGGIKITQQTLAHAKEMLEMV